MDCDWYEGSVKNMQCGNVVLCGVAVESFASEEVFLGFPESLRFLKSVEFSVQRKGAIWSGCLFLLIEQDLQAANCGVGQDLHQSGRAREFVRFSHRPTPKYFPNTAHPPSTSHHAAQNRAQSAQIWPEVQPGQACCLHI